MKHEERRDVIQHAKARAALIGQKFGRWTVLQIGGRPDVVHVHSYQYEDALVRCDCGTQGWRRLGSIKSGKSKGCEDCRARKGRERAIADKERRFEMLSRHAP